MTSRIYIRRSFIFVTGFALIITFLTQCISNQDDRDTHAGKGTAFAGSASCAGCHKSVYESHQHTAHFLTSQPARPEYMKGSFDSGRNKFVLNDRVQVVMEKRKDSFFQVAFLDGMEKQANSIDIIIGSGSKGQTYLDWTGKSLFQLPVSYFTAADQWTNSPGYPGMIVFNRPISSRCMECHSTYATKLPGQNAQAEEFDHKSIVYGVDCEKCHGGASKHVEFHSEQPNDTVAKYILNPGRMSRSQSLDLCALCHGGRLRKTKASFTFKPGDRLYDYFSVDSSAMHVAAIDVHGNQYGLLASSACFLKSEMTCTSCHNVHENERGKLAAMSQKCQNCHNAAHVEKCKMTEVVGGSINRNCVDCHMPKQSSRSITVLLQGSEVPTAAMMRTHLIKIYPGETKKVLDSMRVAGIFNAQ